MNGCLLDTNVISEYNREETPHPSVVKWIETTPETLQYLSVLTLGEIEKGILHKLPPQPFHTLTAQTPGFPSTPCYSRIG
ncbi:MAG: hypothetical protein ACLQU1_37170 [Bryobacteraceae bacterium]